MALQKTHESGSPFEINASYSAPNLKHTINNTQNVTIPSGVYGIWVHMAGGGAGGNGRCQPGQTPNGTGGSGGNGLFGFTAVTPGSTVGVTIGAGGTGGNFSNALGDNNIGNAGGTTFVNTVGTSWACGGGWRTSQANNSNGFNASSTCGKLYGVTSQKIIFTDKNDSPRSSYLFSSNGEGIGFGGQNTGYEYNSSSANVNKQGSSSIYGGGAGGGAVTNSASAGNGGTGGSQTLTGYTGGAGATYANVNSGGGGGGAGISGNGSVGSGTTGGAGGAGGGGGGGGGANSANTGAGGAGGAGAVLIYY
jgi:hypothetical protein